METSTLLVTVVVLLIVVFWFRRHDSRFPPCPIPALPVVGHYFFISEDSRSQFRELHKRCGDIYSLYLGQTLVVVLNGYDIIKEALVKKGDNLSDRPPYYAVEVIGLNNVGLILSNGDNWKEQRLVTLSILRAFGMGKNLLADKIHDEIGCYMKYLKSLNGKPKNINVMTNISMSNIIFSITIGHRFEYDDKAFQDIIKKLGFLLNGEQNVSLINFLFWLRYIPGDIFKAKKMASDMQAIMDLFMTFIQEKKRQVVDPNDVCNLIDAYIVDRNKKIREGNSTFLDDKNLLKIIMDLFIAGAETVSTTVTWCILYMLHNPNIQEKVYQEIIEKVGTERTPTIQDKTQLTYLNAVIMETQRLASIVPMSVTHVCSEEVTLRGYIIPKGAYIIPNLDSVLHDQTTWGNDAMSFRPERFIDDNGKLKNPEQFIPFGIGRRVCMGEALAKMELFLFLSSMFQRFKFLPTTPGSPPTLNCSYGIVTATEPYEVRAVERS